MVNCYFSYKVDWLDIANECLEVSALHHHASPRPRELQNPKRTLSLHIPLEGEHAAQGVGDAALEVGPRPTEHGLDLFGVSLHTSISHLQGGSLELVRGQWSPFRSLTVFVFVLKIYLWVCVLNLYVYPCARRRHRILG